MSIFARPPFWSPSGLSTALGIYARPFGETSTMICIKYLPSLISRCLKYIKISIPMVQKFLRLIAVLPPIDSWCRSFDLHQVALPASGHFGGLGIITSLDFCLGSRSRQKKGLPLSKRIRSDDSGRYTAKPSSVFFFFFLDPIPDWLF